MYNTDIRYYELLFPSVNTIPPKILSRLPLCVSPQNIQT